MSAGDEFRANQLADEEPILLSEVEDRPAGSREGSPSPPSPPHYRAVSVWAVLCIVCAIATLTTFFNSWLSIFALAALYFGYKALDQIERVPEEYTGKLLAKAGMWAAVIVGIPLLGWSLFLRSEVPHGYEVLDYSKLEPDPNSKDRVPNTALELSNNKTKVYVRGYMLPPSRGQWTGLTKFSICRNSDMCKFAMMNGSRPEDQIHIEMTGDRTMKYTTGEIGIGGYFSVDSDQSPQPYYLIKADFTYP
jgi:hypothetical protein